MSVTAAKSPAAKPPAKAVAKPAAKTTPKAEAKKPEAKTSTAPAEKATVSGDAKAPEDPRAAKLLDGLGENYKASTVKTDSWKKGPNDTIEGMLKGKGFSLKDIYTKGPNGQNMVDRVMGANGIKDARKIPDGKELLVPDLGDKGGGTATSGLKPGEKTPEKVIGDHKIQSEKLPDGTNQSGVETKNGSEVKVQSPGESTNATRVRDDGSTATQTLAKDSKGQVTTQVDTTTKGQKDEIQAKALKGSFEGQATPDGVKLANGEVKVDKDLDERKRDGFFENLGRSGAELLGFKGQPVAPVAVSGKQINTTADGNDINVVADGKKVASFDQDADDTLVERGGEIIDNGVSYIAKKGGEAFDYAGDLASRAGNQISNAASGFWNWATGK